MRFSSRVGTRNIDRIPLARLRGVGGTRVGLIEEPASYLYEGGSHFTQTQSGTANSGAQQNHWVSFVVSAPWGKRNRPSRAEDRDRKESDEVPSRPGFPEVPAIRCSAQTRRHGRPVHPPGCRHRPLRTNLAAAQNRFWEISCFRLAQGE